MFIQNLIRISVGHGWALVITADLDRSMEFDFHRKTLSGRPFCFSIRASEDVSKIERELISFIDAFDPDYYAFEWYDKSDKSNYGLYPTIKKDLEDIKNEAWLLILDISSAINHTSFLSGDFGDLCLS